MAFIEPMHRNKPNITYLLTCAILLIWTSLGFTDNKSTLVPVMAWCHQATSHYLNQCWPRSKPPYGVTRPQWVNSLRLGKNVLPKPSLSVPGDHGRGGETRYRKGSSGSGEGKSGKTTTRGEDWSMISTTNGWHRCSNGVKIFALLFYEPNVWKILHFKSVHSVKPNITYLLAFQIEIY